MRLFIVISVLVSVCVSSLDGYITSTTGTRSTATAAKTTMWANGATMSYCQSGLDKCSNQFYASYQDYYDMENYRDCLYGVYCQQGTQWASQREDMLRNIIGELNRRTGADAAMYAGSSSRMLPFSGLIMSLVFTIKIVTKV